jgi:hypothetical protein
MATLFRVSPELKPDEERGGVFCLTTLPPDPETPFPVVVTGYWGGPLRGWNGITGELLYKRICLPYIPQHEIIPWQVSLRTCFQCVSACYGHYGYLVRVTWVHGVR